MIISNKSTIDGWSEFSEDDLEQFGDQGDKVRSDLLDPAILSLLPSLNEQTVLDAGCGNGYLSRKLATQGAIVTGIEPATNLYNYCLEREDELNQGITYRKTDLGALYESNTYDIVISINVLMDIPDYLTALTNCVNALKVGGSIIISVMHPAFPGFESDWTKHGSVQITEYFSPEPIKQKYGYLFHRPIQEYINNLIGLGCTISRVVEPRSSDVHSIDRNAHVPQFLVIKATKNAS